MFQGKAFSGLLVALTLSASAALSAQTRSTVSSTELESTVTTAPAPNRASVQQFLQNSRVIEQAGHLGVSAADLSARVSTMDEASLSDIAARTRAANLGLAGGDSMIIISTTALIIILLLLILLLK